MQQMGPVAGHDPYALPFDAVRCRFGGGSGQELRCARNRSERPRVNVSHRVAQDVVLANFNDL